MLVCKRARWVYFLQGVRGSEGIVSQLESLTEAGRRRGDLFCFVFGVLDDGGVVAQEETKSTVTQCLSDRQSATSRKKQQIVDKASFFCG